MNKAAFDLLADLMRYWFAILILLIVFRIALSVFRQFSKERKSRKESRGYQMGMLEVIDPGRQERLFGKHFALAMENRIGRSDKCDIRVPERSVRPQQALIYQKGNKVYLRPLENKIGVYLNGERIDGDVVLLDGDEIALSHVVFRLRLLQALSGTEREARGTGGSARASSYRKAQESPWEYFDDEESWDDDEAFLGEEEYDEESWLRQAQANPYRDDEDENWDEDEEYEDYDQDEWVDEDAEYEDDEWPPSRR